VKRLSLTTGVWLLAAGAAVTAGAAAVFPAVRLVPVVRRMGAATAPLQPLYERLAAQNRWMEVTTRLTGRVLGGDDPSARDSLERLIDRHDLLTGALPLANVPDSVRILLARSDEVVSRYTASIEELLALRLLGRHDEARIGLAALAGLEREARDLAGQAQLRGLDRLLATEDELGGFVRTLIWVALAWLAGTVSLAALALRFLRRRIVVPLGDLREALGRLRGGDLNVRLQPVAEDELGGLVTEFNQMAAVLRARAESQGQMTAASELLAGAAHEVNNPLMAITGTVEELLHTPNLPETARRDLRAMLEDAQRAGRLLRALVRFVRPSPPTRRPLDINEVVRDAFGLVATQFRSDGIATSLALAPEVRPVRADGQRLGHVLVALLMNAHEALRRSGRTDAAVSVRTWMAGDRAHVEVCDNGAGVAPEVRPRLFLPFATAREGGHIGLGLYSARLAVREYGGEVAYEPPPSGGARFVISLPAEPPAVQAPAPVRVTERPDGTARASLAGLRVLIVDDEELLRLSLARFLTRRGAVVREASDGAVALELLAREPSDVVVTDLRMPRMDGIAFYTELRRRDPVLAERVVFLSGDVAELGRLRADEVPAERVLTKPVRLAELEDAMRRVWAH
jgi:signal transduction histidine kinase